MSKPRSIEKILSLDSLNRKNQDHYEDNPIQEVTIKCIDAYLSYGRNPNNLSDDYENLILKKYLIEQLTSRYHELGFKSYPKYNLKLVGSIDNESVYREEVILYLKSLGLNELYDIYKDQV